jgi:hypothetical protein
MFGSKAITWLAPEGREPVRTCAGLDIVLAPLFMTPRLKPARKTVEEPVFVSSTHLGWPPARVPSTTSEMKMSAIAGGANAAMRVRAMVGVVARRAFM